MLQREASQSRVTLADGAIRLLMVIRQLTLIGLGNIVRHGYSHG